MKTLSLSLSKKIAGLGVNIKSDLVYIKYGQVRRSGELIGRNYLPAYTLQDLPAVLREIDVKKGWSMFDSEERRRMKIHFEKICFLFAETGELGEGSLVEKYLIELL
jgi:hypothetical protein